MLWRAYAAIWRAERGVPPHAPSFEAVRVARCGALSIDALTWGETPFVLALDLLRRAGAGPGSTVLDLGAGRGMVLLASHALGAAARGVELDPRRVRPVKDTLAAVGASLVEGDARTVSLEGVTHVWLSWTCMPKTLRAELVRLLEGLTSGARVVCFTWPLHDEHEPARGAFALLHTERRRFPWGITEVMLVERRAAPFDGPM